MGVEVKRKLGASREGGSDIELDSKSYIDSRLVMRTHPGWSIEVKNHQRLSIGKWWDQTLEQATKEEKRPLLVFRGANKDWNFLYYHEGGEVITDFLTWLKLYEENKV